MTTSPPAPGPAPAAPGRPPGDPKARSRPEGIGLDAAPLSHVRAGFGAPGSPEGAAASVPSIPVHVEPAPATPIPAAYSWERAVPATASVARRTVAFGIDLIIVFALAWMCTFVAAAAGVLRIPDVVFDGRVVPILGLLAAVSLFEIPLFLLYTTLFHRFGGRTPGKLLTGIRVVRIDGRPIGMEDSFLRSLLYLLWVTPVGVAFILIDAWTLHATELDQRLGDLAAGTVVVTERTA